MRLRSLIVLAMTLALTGSIASADALHPVPGLEITGQGVQCTTAGTGMRSGSGQITVQIDGPVVHAMLYWAVRDWACPQDGGGNCLLTGADDDLLFGGDAYTGFPIGAEINIAGGGSKTNNIGYAADVTDTVIAAGTGMKTFDVLDNDIENTEEFDGAGLLVIYVDPADPTFYRIVVFEGLDFAYQPALPDPEARVTEAITFDFLAAASDRSATVAVMVGDAEASRPDSVEIDGMPILNEMDSDDGASFDADEFPVTILANSTQTTVQLFSDSNEELSGNPDSLLWLLGVLRIPLADEPESGRMTGGGNQVRIDGVRITRGFTLHCDVLLSNNLEINWSGGNKWHMDKPISEVPICIDDPDVDPFPPAAPFDTFIGEAKGSLNNMPGDSICRFTFVDAGEPGSDDMATIRIWEPGADPDVDTPVLEVSGKLDGGNIQAHYDQPHK